MSTVPPNLVDYPDSDGLPMADNTVQFDWIAILKWNLEALFRDDPRVFVAGDHLIYPVEGSPETRTAPDVYVAFGRPKKDRGSYKVWEEDGVFPQVVFEVWSPGNRFGQMAIPSACEKGSPLEVETKRDFYRRFGAEEYYILYPEPPALVECWHRAGDELVPCPADSPVLSPRLGLRFEFRTGELTIFGPDGRPFLRPDQILAERDAERARADAERLRADRLAAKLRELGFDPDAG